MGSTGVIAIGIAVGMAYFLACWKFYAWSRPMFPQRSSVLLALLCFVPFVNMFWLVHAAARDCHWDKAREFVMLLIVLCAPLFTGWVLFLFVWLSDRHRMKRRSEDVVDGQAPHSLRQGIH